MAAICSTPTDSHSLKADKKATTWREVPCDPLPVNNRTVLHLLEALQTLQVKVPGGGPAESRRLSFRALDIEQIGHVYEGLLDHTAKRATEPVLGLVGAKNQEPEIALAELEKFSGEDAEAKKKLMAFLKDETNKTEKALEKAIDLELEPEKAGQFQAACGNDEKLWKRVKPFAGLIRDDDFGHPVVIPKGSVYVTEGTDRRSSGTHYTPRSLTEPIVQYTLEPLVYVGPAEGKPKEEWKLHTPAELLELNICDMACGSGAFLVQACRYLAERLVEAWEIVEKNHPGIPGITPEGTASTGKSGENLIPEDTDERMIFARRIVAQRCLYGVDKNPLASEMAKLSLWLLTLQKDKPFTFLNHAIRSGDSLVGIANTHQLTSFSLDGKGIDMPMFTDAIEKRLDAVRLLRRQISELPNNSAEDVQKKALMLRNAEEQTKRLAYAANYLLAACWESTSETDRDERLKQALVEVEYKFKDLPPEQLEVEGKQQLQKVGCPKPFHWPLEFPEVFMEGGGFDGIVGNPPFMHGSKIAVHQGTAYADYLRAVNSSAKGKVNLVVFFMLRAVALSRKFKGTIGIIVPDTVSEGHDRLAGTQTLLDQGYVACRATTRIKWPGSASVIVSLVNFFSGRWAGKVVLNDELVELITSRLDSDVDLGTPHKLLSMSEVGFLGVKPDSLGFVVEADEASAFLANHPKYQTVLKPYISGIDLNRKPILHPDRFIADFTGFDEEEAQQHFPLVFARVRELVKPHCKWKKWWQFNRPAARFYELASKLETVMATSRVTKFLAFQFVPANWVYAEQGRAIPD